MGKVLIIKNADFRTNKIERDNLQPAAPIVRMLTNGKVEILGVGSLYYTTDGTTPTNSSTLYTEPFYVDLGTTIKAVDIKNGVSSAITTSSDLVVESYRLTSSGPVKDTECVVSNFIPITPNVSFSWIYYQKTLSDFIYKRGWAYNSGNFIIQYYNANKSSLGWYNPNNSSPKDITVNAAYVRISIVRAVGAAITQSGDTLYNRNAE